MAVIFMFIAFVPVAYAVPEDDDPPGAAVTVDIPAVETMDLPTDEYPSPFTPPGTGTVIDYGTDEAGKVFYTIITPDKHVFYLVIDRARNAENVYFLNAVTIDDLMPLATKPVDKSGNKNPDPPVVTDPPPTTEPTPDPEPAKNGGKTGMIIMIIIVIVIGGGAGYYFKIYRPKQQGAVSAEAEDYSPEEAIDGPDDWDERELDAPDWDNGDDFNEDFDGE